MTLAIMQLDGLGQRKGKKVWFLLEQPKWAERQFHAINIYAKWTATVHLNTFFEHPHFSWWIKIHTLKG